VKLLFDTSVWIEHLRHAALASLIEPMRGRFTLGLDAVVASELRAGCRSKRERRIVDQLCAPFERSGRLLCPLQGDFERAAGALSRLRERGQPPSGAKGALLDALIATVATHDGALLVTANPSDFEKLAREMPLRMEPFDLFRQRLIPA
jgi:predicted nucleic acid-binding protein